MQASELLNLFDCYSDMVYRLAVSCLRSRQDAEDTVQAVFLKLLEGRAQPFPGKERAFLTQVTVNHCRDILRSAKRRQIEPLPEDFIVEEEDRTLFHAVMDLPDKYRIVIHLHYYEGYSFQEIAKFLKISPSAVSMRIHRARKMLKDYLEEERYESQLQTGL